MVYYKSIIRKKIKSNKYDVVVIGVMPHSFLGLCTVIRKSRPSLKIIVDLTDPLSINVSYINYWRIYKLWIKLYEKRHLRNANKLIVLNTKIKNYYEELYPFLEEVIVLEQGTNEILKSEQHTYATRTGMELIYAGMFYKKIREPFQLYKSIESLGIPIRLSIFGSFKKIFLPPHDKKFYYGGLVSKEELDSRINDYDIVVFIDNFFGIQNPGKILENLATKKPILFIYEDPETPTRTFTNEYDGVFYSKNDSAQISDTIKFIIQNNIFYFERDLSKHCWVSLVKESYYL